MGISEENSGCPANPGSSSWSVPDSSGEFSAFGISGGLASEMKALFMTHPPLEIRIAALREAG